jgi:hypothetical protein
MGSSCSFSKKNFNNTETIIKASSESRSNHNPNNDRHQVNDVLEEHRFKDFEEYEEDYVNEGIKRMKAYKCHLPCDELYKLRTDFWRKYKINSADLKISF